MPTSINDREVQAVLDQARADRGTLFPSPEDWRDQWIYFLMLDRFNNPEAPPRNLPYNAEFNKFQGGTYNGVRDQLKYLQQLGVGAIWLSPVLKNPQFDETAYHGYGIQNFLAVEPRFASSPDKAESELRQLVDEAHALGIYVIFDIVLHHAGDVFEYVITEGDTTKEFGQIDWSDGILPIRWRDENGHGNPLWTDAPSYPPLDATVFPDELRQNSRFTRRGNAFSRGFHPFGDFNTLKGTATDVVANGLQPVHNILIRSYQYIIAKFDVDAYRIDTLKFLSPDFERIFGNAMREFALSAGKKNFFTFGEVFDNEDTIALFIGRNTSAPGGLVGVDAALDYPLFFKLPDVLKGLSGTTPLDAANVFEIRKRVEQDIITSHGEAGKFFVTFLDNHDQGQRFGFTGPTQLVDQIALGLGCLFSLQGIPCLYYGTEQGLSGHKDPTHLDDSMVREALWGRTDAAGLPNGFDMSHPLYRTVQQIAKVRAEQPALRYGRQYFRQVSGNRTEFGISPFPSGVLAFSRILNDGEVVVVANTNTTQGFQGEVIVDHELNPEGALYKILYSNKKDAGTSKAPGAVVDKAGGSITIHEIDGSVTSGPARVLPVNLQATEIQILGR
jgi:glycosidase